MPTGPINWPDAEYGSGTGATYISPNGNLWTWSGYAWEGEGYLPNVPGGEGIDGANSRRWDNLNAESTPSSPGFISLIDRDLNLTTDPSQVVNILINKTDNTGADLDNWFRALVDSPGVDPYQAYIQITNSIDNNIFGIYSLSKSRGLTDYYEISVGYVAGSTPAYEFSNGDELTFSWVAFGAQGPEGPQGLEGPQGPAGPAATSSYRVFISNPSIEIGYQSDAFWFTNLIPNYLETGGTCGLSIVSLEYGGTEYISSLTEINLTGSTGPEDKWYCNGYTSGVGATQLYYSSTISIGEVNSTIIPKAPIKWISHLNSIGFPIGVKFCGITEFVPDTIALKDDVDFKLIIKRNSPGLLEQDNYWYKWEYSTSTKLVNITFSNVGPSGSWQSFSYGENVQATIGEFYS